MYGDTPVRLWSWLPGFTQSGVIHLSLRIFSPPCCPVFSYITLPSFLPQGLCTCPSPTARMTPIPFSICSNPTHLGTDSTDGFLCPASVTRALALLHRCLTSSTSSVCWRQTLIFIRLFYFIYWRKAMVGRREIFL